MPLSISLPDCEFIRNFVWASIIRTQEICAEFEIRMWIVEGILLQPVPEKILSFFLSFWKDEIWNSDQSQSALNIRPVPGQHWLTVRPLFLSFFVTNWPRFWGAWAYFVDMNYLQFLNLEQKIWRWTRIPNIFDSRAAWARSLSSRVSNLFEHSTMVDSGCLGGWPGWKFHLLTVRLV